MQVTVGEFRDIGKRVVLVGKLDIAGAQTIELPMATLAGSRCNLVVGMIGVQLHCFDWHPASCARCESPCA